MESDEKQTLTQIVSGNLRGKISSRQTFLHLNLHNAHTHSARQLSLVPTIVKTKRLQKFNRNTLEPIIHFI